jgi:hypothetical protein
MKILVSIILTGLLAFIAGLYLPWWGLAIAAFVVSIIIPQRGGKAFLSAFIGVFLLWAGMAWLIDSRNESILSEKIASVFPLGGNSILLILVTAIIGGLVAGFAAMSGSYLRSSTK